VVLVDQVVDHTNDDLLRDIAVQLHDATVEDCVKILEKLHYRVVLQIGVNAGPIFPYTLQGTIQLFDFLTIIGVHEHMQMHVTVARDGITVIDGRLLP
jgi:hypothetical protein